MINHENNAMKITRYTVMYIGHSSKSNIVDDNTISDCDECADLTDSKSKPEQSKRAINECISLKNFFWFYIIGQVKKRKQVKQHRNQLEDDLSKFYTPATKKRRQNVWTSCVIKEKTLMFA